MIRTHVIVVISALVSLLGFTLARQNGSRAVRGGGANDGGRYGEHNHGGGRGQRHPSYSFGLLSTSNIHNSPFIASSSGYSGYGGYGGGRGSGLLRSLSGLYGLRQRYYRKPTYGYYGYSFYRQPYYNFNYYSYGE